MTSRSDLSAKVPVDGNVPAKAFVLEVHADDPDAYLTEIAGRGNVQDTDDAFLSRVFAASAGEFWVDRLQPRFWVFHTTGASVPAAAWLRDRLRRRRPLPQGPALGFARRAPARQDHRPARLPVRGQLQQHRGRPQRPGPGTTARVSQALGRIRRPWVIPSGRSRRFGGSRLDQHRQASMARTGRSPDTVSAAQLVSLAGK